MRPYQEMSDRELLKYRYKLELESIDMVRGPQPSGDMASDHFDRAHAQLEHEIWQCVVPEMNRRGIRDRYQR